MANESIKINTSMIEDFSLPVSDVEGKYLYVNEGKIIYHTPSEVFSNIESKTKRGIAIWQSGAIYYEHDLVTYENNIYECNVAETKKESFDAYDWKLLSGYYKDSDIITSGSEGIPSIILDEPVSSKYAVSINVNGLILQTDAYSLGTDNKTITFNPPIEANKSVEVTVYGNMIIPTNVSNIMVETFTPMEETDEFFLGEQILDKKLITVNVDGKVLQQNEWSLIENLHTVKLNESVVDKTVQISWFNNVELTNSAIYTPHVESITEANKPQGFELSWSNTNELENPQTVTIYGGTTFTPIMSQTGDVTTISWENDGGLDNPDTIELYGGKDGVTFTPTVTKDEETGISSISWTNDGGLENPETVEIKTKGINIVGQWSVDKPYTVNDYVTFEDDGYQYSYIALKSVPVGTSLDNTEYWFENTKIAKQIVAQIIEWSE